MFVTADTDAARHVLATFIAGRLGVSPQRLVGPMPYRAAAIIRGQSLMGAVIFADIRETSLTISWAGNRGWATRSALRSIFSYAFDAIGVLRCIGVVERSNRQSRDFAARLGWREVGVLDHEYGPNRDGILYAMTRERCRWIDGGQHGKSVRQ